MDCWIGILLCSIYTNIYLNSFNSYPNPLVPILISVFWIILSYILGRYTIFYKINLISIVRSLLKMVFIFVISNLIYLILNWASKIYNIFFSEVFIPNNLLKVEVL